MISNQLKRDLDYTLNALTVEEKNKMENARIIITGCGGFLGYYFLRFFEAHAETLKIKQVIALDNFMLGYPKWINDFKNNDKFVIKKFDIIKDKIDQIENADKADYIIHMASIASPIFYRIYPIETLDANIWGLRALFDFYADKKIKGFLFYSSSEIYGNPDADNIPTSEEYYGYVSSTGPRSCYDESKRFGETMCMLFSQKFSMPIGVARPFNNFGPGMRINDKRVPADFALAIKENRNIEILSSGLPTRTFCYVADSIAGYIKIMLHGKYDYFNIGIERPEITVAELAEVYVDVGKKLFDYTGKIVYAKSNDIHYLTNNPQRRCPDINKAVSVLGYNPTIEIYDGVERFLKFIKTSEEDQHIW